MLRATKPRRFIGQIRDLWREWREVKQLEKESVQNRLTEIRQKTTEAHATLKLLDEKMAEMNPKVNTAAPFCDAHNPAVCQNEKEALRLVREHVGKMKTVSDALDKQVWPSHPHLCADMLSILCAATCRLPRRESFSIRSLINW